MRGTDAAVVARSMIQDFEQARKARTPRSASVATIAREPSYFSSNAQPAPRGIGPARRSMGRRSTPRAVAELLPSFYGRVERERPAKAGEGAKALAGFRFLAYLSLKNATNDEPSCVVIVTE